MKLAAYIGLYYVDELAVGDWGMISRPIELPSAWDVKSLRTVLAEVHTNTVDGSCKDEYQNGVNLCRLALYLQRADKMLTDGGNCG